MLLYRTSFTVISNLRYQTNSVKEMVVTKKDIGKLIGGIAALIGIITGAITMYEYYKAKQRFDLAGKWDVYFHIDKSSYKAYIGKVTTNRMFFFQENEKIKADGEMTQIDSADIPASQHIPMHFEGKISDDKLYFSYKMDGEKRPTVGEITASILINGEIFEGTFFGTAANSSGRLKAIRIK